MSAARSVSSLSTSSLAPPSTDAPLDNSADNAAGRGRPGRRRLQELEEEARRSRRVAEEARRTLESEHERLVAELANRQRLEREVAGLRRDLDRLQESEQLRVAQARYSAERDARRQVRDEIDRFQDEHRRTLEEVARLRGELDDDRVLMSEFSDRLREEQQTRAKARIELEKAVEGRRNAERSLEHAVETARRRAEDELGRLAAAETAVRAARDERDLLAAEVAALTSTDGRIADLHRTVEQLRAELAEHDDLRTANEQRIASLEAERTALMGAGASSNARMADLEAERAELLPRVERLARERDALDTRVQTLEHDLADMTEQRDSLVRALSDERARTGDATQELRRLRAAAIADAPALATGRAEIEADAEADEVAVDVEHGDQEPEPERQQEPEPEPEPEPEEEPDPDPDPLPPVAWSRRSAMAELTALASTGEGEDIVPRRRH